MKKTKIILDIEKFIKKYPRTVIVFSGDGKGEPLTISEVIAALEVAKYEKVLEWRNNRKENKE